MKLKQSLLIAGATIGACIIAFAAFWNSPSSAQRSEQDKSERSRTEYRVSIVLELAYGDGDTQVGLITGREDFRPLGPASFAVAGDSIYILDRVNEQVKEFSLTGQLLRAIRIDHGVDLAVDREKRVYVLDNRMNDVLEYVPDSAVPIRHTFDQPVTDLSLKSDGKVYAMVEGQDVDMRTLSKPSDSSKLTLSAEPYECLKVGEYQGRLINKADGKSFDVTTENEFGSISCLGQDRHQNYYVVVEELLPGDTIQVVKQVRQYTPKGKLRAVIPINIDYVAHPEKEFILDEDGNVYHLLPLEDRLVVEKWTQ